MDESLDLGAGITLRFSCWAPDRELNPQYEGVPDVDRYGASIRFPDGCVGGVTFDGEVARFHNRRNVVVGRNETPVWTVESWDPLTLSPSILQRSLKDGDHQHHGYIRNGRWEDC